jgi:glycogen debranching enzyme
MISSGERDWRDYYKTWNNNMPHQYHNGGIWPWVGGLYVATLVYADRKKQAQTELAMLAAALQEGKEEWECNEYLHGLTGKAMGMKYQAWSAGMFLYAEHAVETGNLPGIAHPHTA